MAAPPSVTVTGTIRNPDGSMYTGRVLFRQPVLIRHTDGTVINYGIVVATAIDGALSADLFYVDAAGWSPRGWSWEVIVETGSVPRRYKLSPSVSDLNSVNLGDLQLIEYLPDAGRQYVSIGEFDGYLNTLQALMDRVSVLEGGSEQSAFTMVDGILVVDDTKPGVTFSGGVLTVDDAVAVGVSYADGILTVTTAS